MTAEAISSVCSPTVSWMDMPPLQRSVYDATTLSNSMEIELRRMISEYREGEGLTWPSQLTKQKELLVIHSVLLFYYKPSVNFRVVK